MNFGAFIAPLGSERFMADYFGKQPVHIPAPEGGRSPLVDWDRLKQLLAIRSHWSEPNINLIMNSRPVGREHYMDEGAQADPNKIGAFLAMGASLVANSIEQIAPEVREISTMLGRHFAGTANANLYCSFGGIQAFDSHYDPHEVFAVHCEGEKVWRIYRNRADAPIAGIFGDEEAQRMIDRLKGPVLAEVRMRPGDLLYIPRGFFHDALASSGASLHVTFGVTPHSARILFRLLEEAALRERPFREYLPDAREQEGALLGARLDELAGRLGAIMRSPAFRDAVASSQAKLVKEDRQIVLPERPALEAYARTDQSAEVSRSDQGAVLRIGGGRELPLGALVEEAEWMIAQPAVVVPQLLARYPHRGEAELRALIGALADAGLFVSYTPEV